MSKPVNKTIVGAFVLGAVVLAVAAIVLFGSGRFFKDTDTWVSFFPGSVKGLNVGSPVTFRGVRVGEITNIIVNVDPIELTVIIPVIYEIDPKRFRRIGPKVIASDKDIRAALISKGLRAQLQMQSLVTGQLAINLDFYPDKPGEKHGVDFIVADKKIKPWMEIPTIPTPLQRLEKSLENISFQEIVEDVRRAMEGIAQLASSPDLHASISELKETLIAVKQLTRDVDSKVEPLATSLDQTLVEARGGIGDARKLMQSNIRTAADSAKTALDQANLTLKSIEKVAKEGSLLRYEISQALKETAAAARSVRVLADYIEQHPDAILRGRTIKTGGQ